MPKQFMASDNDDFGGYIQLGRERTHRVVQLRQVDLGHRYVAFKTEVANDVFFAIFVM